MRVVLFERDNWSLISWLIFIVTGSRWTHSAIEVCGGLYDASESIGSISQRPPICMWGKRKVRVYELEGVPGADCLEWVKQRLGKKYDWVGIFGWVWSVHDQRKFYCFEFVWRMLAHYNYVPYATSKISAKDIITVFHEHSYEGPANKYEGKKEPCL